ncbi:hypothetical protein ACLMJK_007165 [Lecanora helva]
MVLNPTDTQDSETLQGVKYPGLSGLTDPLLDSDDEGESVTRGVLGVGLFGIGSGSKGKYTRGPRRVTIQPGEYTDKVLLFDEAVNDILFRARDIDKFRKEVANRLDLWY